MGIFIIYCINILKMLQDLIRRFEELTNYNPKKGIINEGYGHVDTNGWICIGEVPYYPWYDETGKDNYLYYAGITDVPYDHMDPLKMVEYSAMQVTEPEVLNSIAGPHGEPLHFQGKAY